MNDQAKPVPRLRRRFLRFSVRGMIVLVLLIGGGLGWLVRCAHSQRDAVAAIRAASGAVQYEWEWKNGKAIDAGSPPTPKSLIELLGIDFFGDVTTVRLNYATILGLNHTKVDAAIMRVGLLPRLEKLDLEASTIDDAKLANVQGLTGLVELNLVNTRVTDTGLAHLRHLTKLSKLRLAGSDVRDAGLAHLGNLTNLSALGLQLTKVLRRWSCAFGEVDKSRGS